jgi:hypothetical protein
MDSIFEHYGSKYAFKFYWVILMDEIDWDKLAQQEEWEESGGGEDAFLTAYDDDQYDLMHSDDEDGKEYDYDDDDYDKEVDQFDEYDPYEFMPSYGQLEHVSYGDPALGTTIGGKFSKLEKIMQMQTVPKETLYINKLKAELNTYFSFDKTNHYAVLVQSVPRFWLKNIPAMSATIYMIDKLKGVKLSATKLADYAEQTNTRKEDLFRYYRLLKKYIGK